MQEDISCNRVETFINPSVVCQSCAKLALSVNFSPLVIVLLPVHLPMLGNAAEKERWGEFWSGSKYILNLSSVRSTLVLTWGFLRLVPHWNKFLYLTCVRGWYCVLDRAWIIYIKLVGTGEILIQWYSCHKDEVVTLKSSLVTVSLWKTTLNTIVSKWIIRTVFTAL